MPRKDGNNEKKYKNRDHHTNVLHIIVCNSVSDEPPKRGANSIYKRNECHKYRKS